MTAETVVLYAKELGLTLKVTHCSLGADAESAFIRRNNAMKFCFTDRVILR